MEMKNIDHIGIAVKSIEDASKFYSNILDLKISEPIEVRSQNVKVAFIEIGGIKLELLEPLSDDSPIARFLQKKGQGLHHLCFLVDDIEFALRELKEKNVKLVDQFPRTGATRKRIAFLHPESASGVLIELKES
jgi:methylmalonyl-CoA epimerase